MVMSLIRYWAAKCFGTKPTAGSEDFAFFGQYVPTAHLLRCRFRKRHNHPIHSLLFDVDESYFWGCLLQTMITQTLRKE